MLDPKRIRIRIRKEVKSRIRIRYYLKVRSGSGSEIDWKVGSGSGSEINNFGSATLPKMNKITKFLCQNIFASIYDGLHDLI